MTVNIVNAVRRKQHKCSLDIVNVGRAVNLLLRYFRHLSNTDSRIHGFTIFTIFTIFTAYPAPALPADCRVIDPELQGTYEGGCKHGLADGFGVAKGSAEYRGEFSKGLKDGKGVKTWAWGDRYEGGFVNDRRQGKGMYTWGAGSPWAGERYVGDYVADKREGLGTYFWPTGDRFEGVWKDDLRYGYSAMEQRRQAAKAAREKALQPGVQVCSWGRTGIAYPVLKVGQIEAVDGNVLRVRLQRLEGNAQGVGGSNLQPGMVLDVSPSDWMPCS